MCMEDIRMGRKMTSVTNVVVVPSNNRAQICGADMKRVRLTVSCDAVTLLLLSPRGIPLTGGFGIGVTPTNAWITFRIEDFGTIVTGEWFANAGAQNVNCTVVETRLEDE